MRKLGIGFVLAAAGLTLLAGCSDDAEGGGATGGSASTGGGSGTGGESGTGGSTNTGGGSGTGGESNTGGAAGGDASGGASDTGGASTGGGNTGGSVGGGGNGGGPEFTVEVCDGAPTATPGADVCAVSGDGAKLLIVGDVLTPGVVYESGAVLVDADGVIECVGCDCFDEADVTEVVCPDAVVSPGLINAHDHIGWFNGDHWSRPGSVPAELKWEHRHDWRRGNRGNPEINDPGGSAHNDSPALTVNYGEVRFALSGVTALFGSGTLKGMVRDVDASFKTSADRAPNNLQAFYQTFPLNADAGDEMQQRGCDGYDWASKGASGSAYVPHVSEGIDQEARNEFHCLVSTAQDGRDYLDEDSSIIHGVGLTAAEYAVMADRGIGLIWSPRTNISLYGDTARMSIVTQMGIDVGLGTDWLPSGSINMLRELQCAAEFSATALGGALSDRHLWEMATLGSAKVLGLDSAVGELSVGKLADVAVFARGAASDPYSAVVQATEDGVAAVFRGGEITVGNSAVVAALETGCDEVGEICGVAKRACTQRDMGVSWASIVSAAEGKSGMLLDLAACGEAPDDEPTCIPARSYTGSGSYSTDAILGSGFYAGVSTEADPDGDGLEGAADNCPTVFNPVRPVDGGAQRDLDGDGLGDECDPCIYDATNAAGCGALDADDYDGDGVANGEDNCWLDANEDQADDDLDDVGNVCDAGASEPATVGTVTQVRAAADGTRWQVEGVCVTAVQVGTVTGSDYNAIWVQDPALATQAGLFLMLFDDPISPSDLAIGQEVTVVGERGTFQTKPQFTDVTVTRTGTCSETIEDLTTVITDASTIADAGADKEKYQDMLVRIDPPGATALAVTDTNPDAPSNFGSFVVTGDLIIGSYLLNTLQNGAAQSGKSYATITGIPHYLYGEYRFHPRSTADLVED